MSAHSYEISQVPPSASSTAPTSFVEVQEPTLTVVHDDVIPDLLLAEDFNGKAKETFTSVAMHPRYTHYGLQLRE